MGKFNSCFDFLAIFSSFLLLTIEKCHFELLHILEYEIAIAFSFIILISFSETLTKREAAILKISQK